MTLRDQMAVDACAILNTNELGERATWTAYGSSNPLPRDVRFIEQPEIQTVRRANIWTATQGTSITQGDTFKIRRNNTQETWRVLYCDPRTTGLQRAVCHKQLADTFTVTTKLRVHRPNGSSGLVEQGNTTSYRCQWFNSSAEIDTDNRRRYLQGEWYCLCEIVPDLKTDIVLTDSSGRAFRVDRLERPFNRLELPYLVCTRSDA